jgi:hypothetical protein
MLLFAKPDVATMPVAGEAVASLKLGFQLVADASNIAGITKQAFDKLVVQDASLGNVYCTVQESQGRLMDQRAILCESDGFEMKQSKSKWRIRFLRLTKTDSKELKVIIPDIKK